MTHNTIIARWLLMFKIIVLQVTHESRSAESDENRKIRRTEITLLRYSVDLNKRCFRKEEQVQR